MKDKGRHDKEQPLSTPPARAAVGTRLAEQLLIQLDPELIRFLLSHDRTPDPARDAALIADRLSQLGVSTSERTVAAIAALESNSSWQDRELARLAEKIDHVESRSISRLGATGISVSVLVGASAVVAAVAQVLQYLSGR